MNVSVLYYFSLRPSFIALGFTDKVLNETVITNFFKFYNGHSRGSVIRKYVK